MNAFFYDLINSEVFKVIGIPALIFCTKIIDVTFSTLGVIFTSKGYKKLSSTMSFFEICIYLFAISQIIQNFTNVLYYMSYAGGYTLGTYVGICIEEKLSIGFISIRLVTHKKPDLLIQKLRQYGYEITSFQAKSINERVRVIQAIFKRKDINAITEIIHKFDKKALYSIEDLKRVSLPVYKSAV